MEIVKIYWIEHPNKLGVLSSGKVRSMFFAQLKNENLSGEKLEDYTIVEVAEKIEELKAAGAIVEDFEG